MGEAGEGQNITHQQKKMGTSSIKAFRDRFSVPIPDDQAGRRCRSTARRRDSPEMNYLRKHRTEAMGGSLPARKRKATDRWRYPSCQRCSRRSSRAPRTARISTTMAFVRILNIHGRDKKVGKRL